MVALDPVEEAGAGHTQTWGHPGERINGQGGSRTVMTFRRTAYRSAGFDVEPRQGESSAPGRTGTEARLCTLKGLVRPIYLYCRSMLG